MPYEAMRESLVQIAREAGAVVRDTNRPMLQRAGALVVVISCASPFALVCLISIVGLSLQIRDQGQRCMEADMRAREERMEIAKNVREQREEIDKRMAVRDEKNAMMISSALKEVTGVIAGKRFIPSSTKKEDDKKGSN